VSEDVSSALVLSDEEEKELLRSCWYSHDARWYMAVAQEFGASKGRPYPVHHHPHV